MSLRAELLEILACPECKQLISEEGNGTTVVCRSCRLIFPVENGIPVMLLDEALKMESQ
jgi:uncharacterized protein YbaR (Trm112 family)